MKKYREARNWLMRKIYGDALIYYLISLGTFRMITHGHETQTIECVPQLYLRQG